MSEQVHGVVVTREDVIWLADVPALEGAHTYVRSLSSMGQAIREAIVLAADLPDEAMPQLVLDYRYEAGDPRIHRKAGSIGGQGTFAARGGCLNPSPGRAAPALP